MVRTPILGKLLLGALYTSIAVAIAVTAMLAVSAGKKPNTERVFLGDEELVVLVADTEELRVQGLSGKESLGQKTGMFFKFPTPGMYGFWMKDMKFPIDIIWFDEQYRIVDVWEHASPPSYPKVVLPRTPAKFVLEVQAGFFADHHLKMGNILEIPQ